MPPKKYSGPRPVATADSTQPKQRTLRAPQAKPSGVSNAEWRAEVQRREAVTTDRRNRLNAKKAKAAAAVEQAEASRAGMMNPPGHGPQATWGSQCVAGQLLPPPPPWGYAPSPSYSDGDTHGRFNPNITFPHGAPPRASPSGLNPDQRTPMQSILRSSPCQESVWQVTRATSTSHT